LITVSSLQRFWPNIKDCWVDWQLFPYYFESEVIYSSKLSDYKKLIIKWINNWILILILMSNKSINQWMHKNINKMNTDFIIRFIRFQRFDTNTNVSVRNDSLTQRFTDTTIHWHNDSLTQRFTDTTIHWHSNLIIICK
jgi:hypothetical protein